MMTTELHEFRLTTLTSARLLCWYAASAADARQEAEQAGHRVVAVQQVRKLKPMRSCQCEEREISCYHS